MSHCVDETYEVYNEICRRARKEHTCDACKETIQRGHVYFRIFLVFEREFTRLKRCMKCQAIHKHLRGLDPGNMWPSERLNCGEEYQDTWGCEPPPLIASIAFMSQSEAQQELAKVVDADV